MNEFENAVHDIKHLESNVWLIKYFPLYKKVVIWPEGLPPISRTDLNQCKSIFLGKYEDVLKSVSHYQCYETKDLIIP